VPSHHHHFNIHNQKASRYMQGKVTLWKESQGCGFIQADDGREFLFNRSGLVGRNEAHIGDRVTFELGTNSRTGRELATAVRVTEAAA
jgi:cold shock CspA family protein